MPPSQQLVRREVSLPHLADKESEGLRGGMALGSHCWLGWLLMGLVGWRRLFDENGNTKSRGACSPSSYLSPESQYGSTFPISSQVFWKLWEASAHTASWLLGLLVQSWRRGALTLPTFPGSGMGKGDASLLLKGEGTWRFGQHLSGCRLFGESEKQHSTERNWKQALFWESVQITHNWFDGGWRPEGPEPWRPAWDASLHSSCI